MIVRNRPPAPRHHLSTSVERPSKAQPTPPIFKRHPRSIMPGNYRSDLGAFGDAGYGGWADAISSIAQAVIPAAASVVVATQQVQVAKSLAKAQTPGVYQSATGQLVNAYGQPVNAAGQVLQSSYQPAYQPTGVQPVYAPPQTAASFLGQNQSLLLLAGVGLAAFLILRRRRG